MIIIPREELHVPEIQPGRYHHYKGNDYEVVCIALHSETNDPFVIYKPLNKNSFPIWIRPYAMFLETIVINGKEVQRFERIS